MPRPAPTSDGRLPAGRRVAVVTLGCARNEVDSEELAGRLSAEGYELVDDAEGADAVLVVTPWSSFTGVDLERVATAMRGDLVLDGRNLLDPAAVTAAGLRYAGIGRGGAEPANHDGKAAGRGVEQRAGGA